MNARQILPNALTFLRILLTPLVVDAIVHRQAALAIVLFVAAGVTDILDGAAARRLAVTSSTGAYLDPIADKLLLSAVFLALAAGGFVPWWFVGIVLGRDVFILAGAGWFFLFTPLRKFPPTVWGKLSTFVQLSTAMVWMVRNLLQISQLNVLATAMLWVCSATTVWSGIHYGWRGIQLARVH